MTLPRTSRLPGQRAQRVYSYQPYDFRTRALRSVADALRSTFAVPVELTGIVLVIVTAAVILGGIKRIGQFTELLVPFMAIFYLLGGIVIILMHADQLPRALGLVFEGAFSGSAAAATVCGPSTANMASATATNGNACFNIESVRDRPAEAKMGAWAESSGPRPTR